MTARAGLLGLCMIVKNEAAGIRETLRSIAPFIDYWTILDTGSTDDTMVIIREELAGIPGDLVQGEFTDFAETRNRCLDAHGDITEFVIMLSGDDIVTNGMLLPGPSTADVDGVIVPVVPAKVRVEALRSFLRTRDDQRAKAADVFFLTRVTGADRYQQAMVLRTGTGWRYEGRTHEALSKPGCFATESIPNVTITRQRDGTPEQKRARWLLDRDILKEDLQRDPTNARAAFYLAQTYECLGDLLQARVTYQQRIAMGGFAAETYEAMFRLARVKERTLAVYRQSTIEQTWPHILEAYLDAHAFDPTRAEPLYAIAQHYYNAKTPQGGERNYALCYQFARGAYELPMPTTVLFVDTAIYTWKAADLVAICAFNLGQVHRNDDLLVYGALAARQALDANPGDLRIRENEAFYRRAGF